MSFYRGTGAVDSGAVAGTVLLSANNLSDVQNASTARDNLGLTATGGAATVGFSPVGNISSINVQAAIAEEITDLAASFGSSLVGFIQSGTGAVATNLQAFLQNQIVQCPFNFMTAAQIADWQNGTYLYDHAPFINLAIATGSPVYLPPGNPNLLTAVTASVHGQRIFGAGRILTKLRVPATFNLAALGVFIVSSGEPGPEFDSFGIQFIQPDTAVYGNLTAYPPAFYLTPTSTTAAQARTRFSRMRITNAKTCIDARGNNGGAVFSDLELSHYDFGIRIDGALDTMRLLDVANFNYDMTANQSTLFYSASNIGLESGRCDDLKVTDGLTICGQGMKFYGSSVSAYSLGGNTFGSVFAHEYDGCNGILMSDGDIRVVGAFFTNNAGAYYSINHTGGQLNIGGGSDFYPSQSTVPSITSNIGSGATCRLTIDGCSIRNFPADQTALSFSASSGALNVIFTNNQLAGLPQNTSPVNPFISVGANAKITFEGNEAFDKGTGTGTLLKILNDDNHIVKGNAFLGWGVNLPANYSSLIFEGNSSVSGDNWQSYTPTVSSGTGTFTSVSATGLYRRVGNKVIHFTLTVTITTNGTAASTVIASLPFSTNSATAFYTFSGREVGLSGKSVTGTIAQSQSNATIVFYDGTYPGANGAIITIDGVYQTA